jgi:hypothetical protein
LAGGDDDRSRLRADAAAGRPLVRGAALGRRDGEDEGPARRVRDPVVAVRVGEDSDERAAAGAVQPDPGAGCRCAGVGGDPAAERPVRHHRLFDGYLLPRGHGDLPGRGEVGDPRMELDQPTGQAEPQRVRGGRDVVEAVAAGRVGAGLPDRHPVRRKDEVDHGVGDWRGAIGQRAGHRTRGRVGGAGRRGGGGDRCDKGEGEGGGEASHAQRIDSRNYDREKSA